MKTFFFSIALLFTLNATSLYEFKVPGLLGKDIDFSKYKGKKILIVNTASKCGNTKQYEDLEALYAKYKDKLVIVGFPANNFNGQEPGSREEIAEFCKKNYGVTFPMADKVSVKGNDIAPIFQYIVSTAEAKGFKDPIQWNFTKFLFDEKGELLTVFHNKARLKDGETDARSQDAYKELLKYLN